MLLEDLLRDSAYKLDQFKPAHIDALQASITIKDAAKKPAPDVNCLVHGKPIKLTPEEAIRQLYVMVLRDDLGYPSARFASWRRGGQVVRLVANLEEHQGCCSI